MRILLYIVFSLSAIWIVLTLWVQRTGPSKTWEFGRANNGPSVLVIFNPDPIYNLDEQICLSLGRALAENKLRVQVAIVAAAVNMKNQGDIFVLCANTYNWQPDRAISNFIRKHPSLKGKKVIAITLGAGSTGTSQQKFERLIKKQGANLVSSKSFWLLKPNDETRMKDSNVNVASEMSYKWGKEIAKSIYP